MGAYEGYQLPKNIIMVSTADWDEPLWTNKQQIASRLVSDFRVLYVEPLSNLANGRRGFSHRYWRDATGVHILRPPGMTIPFGKKIPQVNEINHQLVLPIIRQQIEKLGFTDYILWVYPPWDGPYVDLLKPAVSCYDCVDEYSAMPGAWIAATRAMERQLLDRVDVVFTTAKTLYNDKKRYNPNTHFISNVADFDHFHKANTAKPTEELARIPHPIIGYVGAMNYKLNHQLLEKMISDMPDWSFVFIGPDRGFGSERYTTYHNAHFLGKKPIEDLPGFLAAMDVCMIPY
jgi:hypothetical protein